MNNQNSNSDGAQSATAVTGADKKAAANLKRSESLKRAWAEGKGRLAEKNRHFPKLCKCGCGEMTSKDADYVLNHNQRGTKHSPERIARKAAGIKRAWADGEKFKTVRHPSPELIEKRAAKLRGLKRTDAECEKLSGIIKSAWDRGAYDSEQTRSKWRENLKRQGEALDGENKDWMDAIRAKRDMKKLRVENSKKMTLQVQEWKDTGQMDAIRRKAGLGKDMPDHIAAMQWTIRSPNGHVFEFSNLSSWARKNAHLFEDCAPASKSPHWLRIAGGIADLLNAKGRNCSYRGWVAVSKTELEEGAKDMLERDQHPNTFPI